MTDVDVSFGFKVVVVGNSGVGKSSAIEALTTGRYSGKQEPSIVSHFVEKPFKISDSSEYISLMIWDTPGRPNLRHIARYTLQNASICVVVYSIDNKESFESIPQWIDDIKKASGIIPFIIVENKVDLLNEAKITPEESKRMAEQFESPLFRVSVKENLNLKNMFSYLASKLQKDHLSPMDTLPRGSESFFCGNTNVYRINSTESSNQIKNESNCII